MRDHLSGMLAEHNLVAVVEDDVHEPTAWTAHFADTISRDAAAAAVAADDSFAGVAVQAVEVEDEDWARRTQAELPAIRIGRVIVAPPWDIPRPALLTREPLVVVVIEPSRGFGTGHHQSTRLCLALLQQRSVSGLSAIDVGTGSGVLAITAAKLGAGPVVAFDSDPDAVENACENIEANGVAGRVDARVADLTTIRTSAADLVLANLTGTLLARHASDLARLVRPDGSMIVSGFNIDERPRVHDSLASTFDVIEAAEEDDWHAFVLMRRG